MKIFNKTGKRYLMAIIFTLPFLAINGQTVSGHTLNINKKTKKTNLQIENPDSITNIIFHGSSIKTLGKGWEKLTNVRRIYFSGFAVIPSNLDIIPSADEISFAQYNEVLLPADLPFNNYRTVRFNFINKLPDSLDKFVNIDSLSMHYIGNEKLCNNINSLKKLRYLNLSEVKIGNDCLCGLKNLDYLELAMVNFENGEIDLECLANLKSIRIEDTNLKKITLHRNLLKSIYLHENEISEEDIEKIKKDYSEIDITIW